MLHHMTPSMNVLFETIEYRDILTLIFGYLNDDLFVVPQCRISKTSYMVSQPFVRRAWFRWYYKRRVLFDLIDKTLLLNVDLNIFPRYEMPQPGIRTYDCDDDGYIERIRSYNWTIRRFRKNIDLTFFTYSALMNELRKQSKDDLSTKDLWYIDMGNRVRE